MVKIIDVKTRKNKAGEEFNVLILQGQIETIVSKKTGKPYLTARTTSIPCTFEGKHAKTLVGTELPGEILKKEVDEYDYRIPGTKDVIKISHTYSYDPNPAAMVENVVG